MWGARQQQQPTDGFDWAGGISNEVARGVFVPFLFPLCCLISCIFTTCGCRVLKLV